MNDLGDIRRATNNDLPKIIALEQKCFHQESAYTPKQLRYLISQAHSTCLLHEQSSVVHGCIIVLYRRGTEVAGIETISVDPQYRGKGIGKKLLCSAEGEMSLRGIRRIRLEVSLGNIAAVQLYQKSGFRITSILKNYYHYEQHGTHDAYRMVKALLT